MSRSTSESIRIEFGQGSPLTDITEWITSDIELGGSGIFVVGTEFGDTNVVYDPIGLTEHPDVPLEGFFEDGDGGPAELFGVGSSPESPDCTLKVWWNTSSYSIWPCAIKTPYRPMGKVKDVTRFQVLLTSRGPSELVRVEPEPPPPTGWLADPSLAGAVLLLEGTGAPAEFLTDAPGVLSGSTVPAWAGPEPVDGQPTLLFTNGGSLNSYADFGAMSAFLNLGVNSHMTLIGRIKWTGGTGGIAERTNATTIGWAWGVSSNNTPLFMKRNSLSDCLARECATALTSGQWVTLGLTYEGDQGVNGGSIKHYIDGVLQASTNVRTGGGTNLADDAQTFRLGNASFNMPGAGNPLLVGAFGGEIAWVLAFHRILSAAELSSFTFLRT